MTVRDLLKKSMLLIGAVSTGENLSADEAADGLSSLNDLLDSWSTDGLLIYKTDREEFSLVAGQAAYTIGVGGNFNTTNPIVIEEARILVTTSTPNFELPLKIYNVQQYADIKQKAQQSTYPEALYFEKGEPLSTINLYFVPSAVNKLVLYSKKPLTSFTTVNDTVSLPPGYTRAIRYALAMELAVEYGKQPSEIIMMTAQDTKADLMRVNMNPVYMKSDALGLYSAGKPFNYLTGE